MINFILAIVLILFLCSMKKVEHGTDLAGTVYTKEMSGSIKGVATLVIILHHITWRISDSSLFIWIYRESNLFAVGIFLFFSGFGLFASSIGEMNYRKIVKYIGRLLISYFVIFACKIVIDLALGYLDYSIVYNVITLQMYPNHLWYVKAQLICYILFFSGMKIFGNNGRMILFVSIPLFIWCLFSLCLGREYINDEWYDTILCFCIGIVFAKYKEKISKAIYKHPIMIALSIIVISGGLFLCYYRLVYMLTSIASVLFYLMFSHYITIKGKLWMLLGKHSLSIFLLHLVLLDYTNRMGLSLKNGGVILAIIILSVGISIPLDKVITYLNNKLYLVVALPDKEKMQYG